MISWRLARPWRKYFGGLCVVEDTPDAIRRFGQTIFEIPVANIYERNGTLINTKNARCRKCFLATDIPHLLGWHETGMACGAVSQKHQTYIGSGIALSQNRAAAAQYLIILVRSNDHCGSGKMLIRPMMATTVEHGGHHRAGETA
jgi:hypothetical protein